MYQHRWQNKNRTKSFRAILYVIAISTTSESKNIFEMTKITHDRSRARTRTRAKRAYKLACKHVYSESMNNQIEEESEKIAALCDSSRIVNGYIY